MTDDTTPANADNGVATAKPVAVAAAPRNRAPRSKKEVVETAAPTLSAETEKPAKAARAKRGTKITSAKVTPPAKAPKTAAPARAPRPKAAAQHGQGRDEILEDIADLIKLEEENKRLRKLLSEKLHAENADLRKRLGHT